VTAIDQGPVFRQAIKERIEHTTSEDVAFDCGFGYFPAEGGGLVLGYTVVFKAKSPLPGRPVLMHETNLAGHTPTDDQVDEAVNVAIEILREKAAQQLAMP
jgi:hypothetical protein